MRLEDVSMRELIEQPLFWEDFEEDRDDPAAMKSIIAADPDSIEKIRFLDQVEDGTLLDRSSFRKLDFYEVDFTEYARLYLAEGEYSPEGATRGEDVDYSKDYSGIKLLIQDVSLPFGDEGLFALYLKDYEFGFINPLGVCVYPFDFVDGSREQYDEDPERFIRDHVLVHFESEFWDDDFDLKQELFGYYHNLPDVHHPLLENKADIDGLLTAKAVSEKLGVSIPRVMKMVEEGSIDGYKFGGKLLITKSSVDDRIRYVEEHGKPTRGKAPEGKRTKKEKRSDDTPEHE